MICNGIINRIVSKSSKIANTCTFLYTQEAFSPAAANIDQLVIIASAALPVTDPYLIDRISAIAALKDCRVLLCLNKCDLDPADELYDIYAFRVIVDTTTDCYNVLGVIHDLYKPILGRFKDYIGTPKLSAFTGNSGVGKSSILNALDPRFSLAVGEVSKALGRGRHTTRHVELFSLGQDTYVIDTPGFASFDTQELDLGLKEHLPETFPEFAPYVGGCRFVGCSHTKEKGCAVLEAVHQGKIPRSRHASYLRLYNELKDLKAWDKK